MSLALNPMQRRALDAMGIAVWETVEENPGAADPATPLAPEAEIQWTDLQAEVAACTQCPLHQSRQQTVFGVGDRRADWLVVGEAPGSEEDRQGEPFVGRAGQLLNEMLRAVGLQRETVFIANILKCRPPKNRNPLPVEVAACNAYLQRQISLLSPRLILAVGKFAAQSLLKSDQPVGRMRGRLHRYGPDHTPLVVTYHPAYLLRSPAEKRKAWMDLCLAQSAFRETQG